MPILPSHANLKIETFMHEKENTPHHKYVQLQLQLHYYYTNYTTLQLQLTGNIPRKYGQKRGTNVPPF